MLTVAAPARPPVPCTTPRLVPAGNGKGILYGLNVSAPNPGATAKVRLAGRQL